MQADPSVDSIAAGALPVLKRFILVDDGLELKVTQRGVMPAGGGEVHFRCPVRRLRPQQVCATLSKVYVWIAQNKINQNFTTLT